VQAGRGILPPLTNSQIVDKFRILTNEIIDPRRQALIEADTLALDELPDVNTLVGLLAPPVGAVLG
jgi:aconitate decarboxylase